MVVFIWLKGRKDSVTTFAKVLIHANLEMRFQLIVVLNIYITHK